MTWYREWFGEEYLELYAHRDEEEARRQVAFFRRVAGPLDGAVLDLACGMGRHMAELQAHGYHPVGCDLSFTLLRTGIGEYGAMPVARADMRQLPFCDRVFAGLVNFFTSFGYFATEDENLQVVGEMARVLAPDARFLFDYLNVDRELEKLVERETRETPMGRVSIERWFDPQDRSFVKRINIGAKRYLERVRGYALEEIASMFAAHGLAIEHAYGDFSGADFTRTAPRLILVGRRSR
ncbi:MAG: class I SAM-dependent methyltransferase [Acidobacteria bacterium]|nr:class I SAM-dependent methyltransferase [Acidobacteriota bacterium]MBV9477245.1 class I SAM-dependent methyltransferase [Acidobacteriota bacterium]